MGMLNHEYRVKSLTEHFPNIKDELQYVRSFDFFFWDFFLMAKNKVKKAYIVYTCKTIFATTLFRETLKDKQRYGLCLQEITDEKINKFVTLAYKAFIDIKSCNKQLSMVKVFSSLFACCFYEIDEKIETVDILARSARELNDLSSAEALYVTTLISISKMYDNREF